MVGAGIIGLSIARQLHEAGLDVVVIDPSPTSGATFAAAGMIAPGSELRLNERRLLPALQWSASAYPRFVEGLGDVGYRATSTLLVGVDSADRESLEQLLALQKSLGVRVARLSSREVRRREPLLSPAISVAVEVFDDHRVDPRSLASALLERLRVVQSSVTAIVEADVATTATRIELADGSSVSAATVVVATGFAANAIRGVPPIPSRPVFGDILRLRVPLALSPLVSSTVRGVVRGSPVYIVPRDDGTVVIGATEREDGSAATPAGAVHDLLRDAQALVPAVAELELLEVTTRARPATPDNAPLIGRLRHTDGGQRSIVVANGFYRHGVALAPLAAAECERIVLGLPLEWPEFDANRFELSPVPVGAEQHFNERQR